MSKGPCTKKSSASEHPPCDNGQTKGKLTLLELLEASGCTSSQKMSTRSLQERVLHTFEYLAQNRRMILKDKQLLCVIDSRNTKSSKTLAPESIGSEKAFSPFWTEQTKEISKKLWLPQGTDCVDLPTSCLNTSSNNEASGSPCWRPRTLHQKRSCQTTCCPLSKYSVAGKTGGGDIIKVRKIKLNPTREQKAKLNSFADAARYTYNETVARVNGGDKVNRINLRNQLVTEKDNAFFDDKRWLLDTPKVIRQQAVFEAAKNFKSAFANKKAGNIHKFKMGFKSKKKSNGTYVLGIEKQLRVKDNKLAILPSFLGDMRHYEKLPFESVPECDCSIRKDALGQYWLIAPIKVAAKPETYDDRPVVAIDPGVRNFLTCYATNGHGFCLGKDMLAAVMDVLKRIDAVDAQVSKATDAKQRRKLRHHKLKLFQKYKNVRDDFHWKICKILTDNYGAVLLPHLETQALAATLRTKTNREMQASSHWLFAERLRHKCSERNVAFMQPNEAYTSKTCGSCGCINEHLGSSKVFACRSCGNVSHRDLHAARNILLKHLHPCELPPSVLNEIDAYVSSLQVCSEQETNANCEGVAHLM